MTHIELAGKNISPSAINGTDRLWLKITVTNSFHNTKTTVIAKACTTSNRAYKISPSQIKSMMKRLCGNSDCMCGGLPHTAMHLGHRKWEHDTDGGYIIR